MNHQPPRTGVFCAIGTRGDVQPVMVLARAYAAATGFPVRVVTHAYWRALCAELSRDKELRVLMGMNKMTINNFNNNTKKYTEKTKQDKIRELIPMMNRKLLVLPEEQPRFPAARLRRGTGTANPAGRAPWGEGDVPSRSAAPLPSARRRRRARAPRG